MLSVIQAVIFDMDDVLVDTENIDHQIALAVCKSLGIDLTPEEEESRLGRKTIEFYEKLFREKNISLDITDTVVKHFALYEQKLSTELKILPGAASLPRLLKSQGYLLGLVSGSTKRQVQIVLSQLGISELFTAIISAEDVLLGKPDPEGYLLAAARLGVAPEVCVVIEDAPPGIASAKNAGMRVVGVTNHRTRDVSLADVRIDDLTQFDIKTLE